VAFQNNNNNSNVDGSTIRGWQFSTTTTTTAAAAATTRPPRNPPAASQRWIALQPARAASAHITRADAGAGRRHAFAYAHLDGAAVTVLQRGRVLQAVAEAIQQRERHAVRPAEAQLHAVLAPATGQTGQCGVVLLEERAGQQPAIVVAVDPALRQIIGAVG
jgi:hypothetical protein